MTLNFENYEYNQQIAQKLYANTRKSLRPNSALGRKNNHTLNNSLLKRYIININK